MPDDDICHELQMKGIERLSTLNYARYEVSAYAKPGLECRHNLNYWRFGDYLGIGAGAHSKITHSSPVRFARYRHPEDYMRTAGTPEACQQRGPIASDELLFEYLLNQLRLVDGFLLQDMQSSIGITPQEFRKAATNPLSQGLLSIDETTCRTTDKGFRYLNEILLAFLPEKTT
jgi:oxygen-independent coproporphyrinogen-3 oxidase